MRQAEDMTNDSWPVGGSRLRPSPPSDSSWDGMGHVPADWESTPRQASPEEDYDWEAMLATALGIAAPAPVMFPDVDADVDADTRATQADVAPDVEPLLPPIASEPETQPAPANTVPTIAAAGVTSWSGDDILPNRRNGQKRRRFFGR